MSYKQPEMMDTDTPDEVLVESVRSGHEEAFVLLVRRYEHRLYTFASRMIGNASDAEDIVQETLVRVYRHINQFRSGGSFKPWVFQITANLCRDHLRRLRRRRWVPLIPGLAETPSSEDCPDSTAISPDRQAAACEEMALLMQALAVLPEKQRAVILMTRYEGMSYEETAAALHIPVGTVKSRLNIGISRLIKTMETKMS